MIPYNQSLALLPSPTYSAIKTKASTAWRASFRQYRSDRANIDALASAIYSHGIAINPLQARLARWLAKRNATLLVALMLAAWPIDGSHMPHRHGTIHPKHQHSHGSTHS